MNRCSAAGQDRQPPAGGAYALLRPALFALAPHTVHTLARAALSWPMPWRLMERAFAGPHDPRLATRFAGIGLASPIGLAAGLDKDCDLARALLHCGFGFITAGSIMAHPRPGNPPPRLVRYADSLSLADSMGLPSKGRDHALRHLRALPKPPPLPVCANVAGSGAQEIADTVMAVRDHVAWIEISLLCPNIVPPEDFDAVALLRGTLAGLSPGTTPLTVRIPNDIAASDTRLAPLIEACAAGGIAGIKVGGGRPVAEQRLGSGRGTLHGRAVFGQAMDNLHRAVRLARGRLDIKANGGVMTGEDAAAMLRAGAACVDIYSAFIYRGWGAARLIAAELGCIMRREHVARVADFHEPAAALRETGR